MPFSAAPIPNSRMPKCSLAATELMGRDDLGALELGAGVAGQVGAAGHDAGHERRRSRSAPGCSPPGWRSHRHRGTTRGAWPPSRRRPRWSRQASNSSASWAPLTQRGASLVPRLVLGCAAVARGPVAGQTSSGTQNVSSGGRPRIFLDRSHFVLTQGAAVRVRGVGVLRGRPPDVGFAGSHAGCRCSASPGADRPRSASTSLGLLAELHHVPSRTPRSASGTLSCTRARSGRRW